MGFGPARQKNRVLKQISNTELNDFIKEYLILNFVSEWENEPEERGQNAGREQNSTLQN